MTGRHQEIPATQLRESLDGDLLRLWLDGHDEALGELVERHHARLVRAVRHLSHGERDPEAVVQDVWLDVMRGARNYRGDGSLRAWLDTIVQRRIKTTWRARDSRPHTLTAFIPEDTSAAEPLDIGVVLRQQMQGLLAALPGDQADAVWLVDVVGLSVAEAATQLGVATGTVKSRCHRGRERLRLLLRGRS